MHTILPFSRQTPYFQMLRTALSRAIPILFAATTATLPAQVPVVSPAAQQAHAQITAYDGPPTCIACHEQQAQQMFGSVHYQEMAETLGEPMGSCFTICLVWSDVDRWGGSVGNGIRNGHEHAGLARRKAGGATRLRARITRKEKGAA